MEAIFEKEIRGHKFRFVDVRLEGTTEAIYTVEFYYDELRRNHRFEMKMDEEGQWKIQAQILPKYVHDAEFELGDAIEDHES
jgi:hypothetical protein